MVAHRAGQLPSVRIGDAVRSRPAYVDAFVTVLTREQALHSLGKALSDSRIWAKLMAPEFKAKILSEGHAPNTFGTVRKAAAEDADARADAANVIDLPTGAKRDPGADD